jgi:GNAT superfamily N-acetyltransferase
MKGYVPSKQYAYGSVAMDVAEFLLLEQHPGWKLEYWDGHAHFTPREVCAYAGRAITEADRELPSTGREVQAEDSADLTDLFIRSFVRTVEFAGWPRERFEEFAERCISDFLSDRRGARHRASRVEMDRNGRIIGAALVVRKAPGLLLDVLFVSPERQRASVATGLIRSVIGCLARDGVDSIHSAYHLANEPSIRWHAKQGFVEEPDHRIARLCWHCAARNLDRSQKIGDDAEELASLTRKAAYWKAEAARLEKVEDELGYEAASPLFRWK